MVSWFYEIHWDIYFSKSLFSIISTFNDLEFIDSFLMEILLCLFYLINMELLRISIFIINFNCLGLDEICQFHLSFYDFALKSWLVLHDYSI
jgi:hypothetical protein